MSHIEQCERRVTAYALDLIEAIEKKKLNRSAYEGLMWSYVNQPAFYESDRPWMVEHALCLLDERLPEAQT